MQIVFVNLQRVFKFSITEEPVVDENAVLAFSDRLVDHRRRDSRIDAAGKPANNLVVRPDGGADLLNLVLYETGRRPIAFAFANVEEEVTKHFLTQRRVRN